MFEIFEFGKEERDRRWQRVRNNMTIIEGTAITPDVAKDTANSVISAKVSAIKPS